MVSSDLIMLYKKMLSGWYRIYNVCRRPDGAVQIVLCTKNAKDPHDFDFIYLKPVNNE